MVSDELGMQLYDRSIAELAVNAQRLQQITVENKSLREAITGLRQQLATPRSA